jgi:hypothetical protein
MFYKQIYFDDIVNNLILHVCIFVLFLSISLEQEVDDILCKMLDILQHHPLVSPSNRWLQGPTNNKNKLSSLHQIFLNDIKEK